MTATTRSATIELEKDNQVSDRSTSTKKAKPSAKTKSDSNKLEELLAFDSQMKKKWVRQKEALLLGTDEVGRGCLAGPVVAVAVSLPSKENLTEILALLSRLNDSKKLSAKVRQELSDVLTKNCHYAIAESSVEEIDRINILQASFLAMNKAIQKLSVPDSSVVLVDGNQKVSQLNLRQILVVGGDGISASIAAASVIAKVYRDNLMCQLHEEFPHYQWHSNKGYGSKDHRDAILEHGLSSWHRQTFCSRIGQEQLSLLN